MGKYERDKGNRVEREIVNWHRENGVFAERVPLSGASRYQNGGHDVDVYPFGRDEAPLVCEVKARKEGAGSTLLRRWLSDYDALFLHEDRAEDLVVVPKRVWLRLVKHGASAPITNIRRELKNGPAGATSAKHARRRGDESNVNPVEP